MDANALSCPCTCHGRGMDAPCDWDGGCAHLHQQAVDSSDPHARRCARRGDCPGYERVQVDTDAGERTIRIGAPLQTERGLCRVCRDITGAAIDHLENDYWRLYAAIGVDQAITSSDTDPVAGSRELPIPIRPAVRDLAARIATLAVTWAEPIAEHMGIDWDPDLIHNHTRPHAALAKALGVLRYNTHRLIDHDPIEMRCWTVVDDTPYSTFEQRDGIDAALEFCRLHDRAQDTLGLTELVHRLPAPCPRCSTEDVAVMALVRDNGGAEVYCRRCNASYAESDYKRLTLILADDIKAA